MSSMRGHLYSVVVIIGPGFSTLDTFVHDEPSSKSDQHQRDSDDEVELQRAELEDLS